MRAHVTLASGRGLATILSFGWIVIAARELAPSDFGRLMTLLSLGAMMAVAHDAGHTFALSESVAKRPSTVRDATKIVVSRRLKLSLVSAFLTGALYAAAFGIDLVVIVLYALTLVFGGINSTLSSALRGLGEVTAEAKSQVLSRFLMLGCGLFILQRRSELYIVIALYLIADALSFVLLQRSYRNASMAVSAGRSLRKPPIDHSFSWRKLWPLTVSQLMSVVSYRVDVWMVALLRGEESAGRYALVLRVVEATLIPAGAITSNSVRSLTQANDIRAERKNLYRLSIAITSAGVVVTLALAPSLFDRIMGVAFGSVRTTLFLVCASAVVSSVVMLATTSLAMVSRTSIMAAAATTMTLNIVLNYIFLSTFGDYGAALSSLLTQSLAVLLLSWMLARS